MPFKKDFPEIKILAGGVQVCLNPEESIKEPYIDMICYREGEEFIKEVCKRIDQGCDLEDVNGLWFRKENEIIRNGITDKTDINSIADNKSRFLRFHTNIRPLRRSCL